MRLSQLASAALLIGLAPAALADLTTYSQDVEGLDITDPAALGADG